MLSEHEQRALHEVEQQILVEDPSFARSFTARQERLTHNRRRTGDTIALDVAVVLGVTMLLLGSWVGALGVVVATWLVWLMWHSADLWQLDHTDRPGS